MHVAIAKCRLGIGLWDKHFFLQFPLQLEQIEITVEETEGVIMCGTLHNVQAAKPNEQREIEQERERGSGGEMCSLSQRWGGV